MSEPAKSRSPAKSPAKSPSPAKKSPAKPPAKSLSPAKSPSTVNSPPRSPTNLASSPIPETVTLIADENPEEGDDLGVDVAAGSDTASLRSSILKYREENGRTYHAYKDGSYAMPNDAAENERLDLQQTICLLTFDHRLHVAPIHKQPYRVLDAGCGTGIWSIEYADEHPEAQVTGIDLSPIQPSFVPPNVQFFVDDLEDNWTYSTPFDFIFSRFMNVGIKDWPRFFKQSYENLNPGGYIEIQDAIYPMTSDDGTLPRDSALYRWGSLINEGFGRNGRPTHAVYSYERQLAEAGFVDIEVVKEKWPSNWWPRDDKYKQLGIWTYENVLSALEGVTMAVFTRSESENGLGWSPEETQVLLAGVRKDLRNTNIHAYFAIYAIYARKPEMAA